MEKSLFKKSVAKSAVKSSARKSAVKESAVKNSSLGLSHVSKDNRPQMVDISKKKVGTRFAHAQARVWIPTEVKMCFKDGDIQSKKGPVFHTAILAGTMAIKNTAQVIPFCHSIKIESCSVDLQVQGDEVIIDCRVLTTEKTGVEMEALHGACVAALTFYDMCKALSHEMRIKEVRLVEKTGGKSDFKSS